MNQTAEREPVFEEEYLLDLRREYVRSSNQPLDAEQRARQLSHFRRSPAKLDCNDRFPASIG